MLAKVQTGAVIGLDGAVVEVETDISQGLPAFTIDSLPASTAPHTMHEIQKVIS